MRMIANFKLVAYSNSPFKSRYPCSDHHNSLQLYLNTKLSANPIFCFEDNLLFFKNKVSNAKNLENLKPKPKVKNHDECTSKHVKTV